MELINSESLIFKVEKHPCVYDYKHKDKKQGRISMCMKNNNKINVVREKCENRWMNILKFEIYWYSTINN